MTTSLIHVDDLADMAAARDRQLVQTVASKMMAALWEAGWRPQDVTEPAGPAPDFKATLAGNELTIVSMPRRITRRQVIRDKQGRIVETVDIEEDV